MHLWAFFSSRSTNDHVLKGGVRLGMCVPRTLNMIKIVEIACAYESKNAKQPMLYFLLDTHEEEVDFCSNRKTANTK